MWPGRTPRRPATPCLTSSESERDEMPWCPHFLMLERLCSSKKTPLDSKRLPYPKASARAGLGPMQRHIPWSIATIRFCLARAIARHLCQCPLCAESYIRGNSNKYHSTINYPPLGHCEMKNTLFVLILVLAGSAFAYDVGSPTTFSNLLWRVSGTTGTESANSTCTALSLDATGDFVTGKKFSVYGVLACNNNSTVYGVTGGGFVSSDGAVSMFLHVGAQFYWICTTDPQLNATCRSLNILTNSQIGSPAITFVK